MAMAAIANPTSSYSIPCNKISKIQSFRSISLPTTRFPPKSNPISLSFKSQIPNFLIFTLLSRTKFFSTSASLYNFDVADDGIDSDQEDPLTETEEIDEEEEEEEGVEEHKVSNSRELGRLYVGNLPYSMTSVQLAEIFGEAGRVDTVEIVYDRVTDRSRGFAFVTMASAEEAKEAIRMFEGAQVGGRTVKVNFPEVPRGGEKEIMGPKIRSSYKGFIDSPHKIYAGNLDWSLTSQGLRDVFADMPGLLSTKVIYDRDSGRSRGFGFVSFASTEEAEAALNAMNGVEVEGRPLRLNLASEKARPPSPAAAGRYSESSLDSSELLSSINS